MTIAMPIMFFIEIPAGSNYSKFKQKAPSSGRERSSIAKKNILLLLFIEMVFISVHVFINTSCGVNKLHFTSVKRMRGI